MLKNWHRLSRGRLRHSRRTKGLRQAPNWRKTHPSNNRGQKRTEEIANQRSEACIKAIGSGEGTGRMVGASLGGAVATTGVASIPFVGWVLAGAATMIGMDQGAEIGGNMAEDISKEC